MSDFKKHILEFVAQGMCERIANSWCLLPHSERRARLDHVIFLATELAAIRKNESFGTAFHAAAIEAVIEGNWHEAHGCLADVRSIGTKQKLLSWNPFIERLTALCNEHTDAQPIGATLHCPFCGNRHIDEGPWITQPHHTHRCVAPGGCGKEWRVEPYCYGIA